MAAKNTLQPSRILLGIFTLIAWSALMLGLGRSNSTWLCVVAGIGFVFPLASLAEWLVHGYLYHGATKGLEFINELHTAHHWVLFPPNRYTQNKVPFLHMRFRSPNKPYRMADSHKEDAISHYLQFVLHILGGVPFVYWPAWLVTHNSSFMVGVGLSSIGISWVLAYMHGVMHTPGERWVERRRFFQFLDRHHYIHHMDTSVNLNFMLPLCDVLFGTIRLEQNDLELEQFPTFARAKPMAFDVREIEGRTQASI